MFIKSEMDEKRKCQPFLCLISSSLNCSRDMNMMTPMAGYRTKTIRRVTPPQRPVVASPDTMVTNSRTLKLGWTVCIHWCRYTQWSGSAVQHQRVPPPAAKPFFHEDKMNPESASLLTVIALNTAVQRMCLMPPTPNVFFMLDPEVPKCVLAVPGSGWRQLINIYYILEGGVERMVNSLQVDL